MFWKHFDGSRSSVVDGDRDADVVVVGAIESPRLLRHIQFFVREVERIKSLAYPPEEPASRADDGTEEIYNSRISSQVSRHDETHDCR